MDTNSKGQTARQDAPQPASAERRLTELGITLPTPPKPFGIYVEAVQTGNMLFLTGLGTPVELEVIFEVSA